MQIRSIDNPLFDEDLRRLVGGRFDRLAMLVWRKKSKSVEGPVPFYSPEDLKGIGAGRYEPESLGTEIACMEVDGDRVLKVFDGDRLLIDLEGPTLAEIGEARQET